MGTYVWIATVTTIWNSVEIWCIRRSKRVKERNQMFITLEVVELKPLWVCGSVRTKVPALVWLSDPPPHPVSLSAFCLPLPTALLSPLPFRLFEYRGRVSPVPRVVPVKHPRVAVPLVRRVKSLPVKLLARNTSLLPTSNGNQQRCESRPLKSCLTLTSWH